MHTERAVFPRLTTTLDTLDPTPPLSDELLQAKSPTAKTEGLFRGVDHSRKDPFNLTKRKGILREIVSLT